jgi:hypothetical protein
VCPQKLVWFTLYLLVVVCVPRENLLCFFVIADVVSVPQKLIVFLFEICLWGPACPVMYICCYVVGSQGREVTCVAVAALVGRYATLDSRNVLKWHETTERAS